MAKVQKWPASCLLFYFVFFFLVTSGATLKKLYICIIFFIVSHLFEGADGKNGSGSFHPQNIFASNSL
jgi:hypothetical protein